MYSKPFVKDQEVFKSLATYQRCDIQSSATLIATVWTILVRTDGYRILKILAIDRFPNSVDFKLMRANIAQYDNNVEGLEGSSKDLS